MRALEYAFRQGAASLWRSRGSSAFAVLAIALALIVLGVLLLITSNAERLLSRWTSASELSVYLGDAATSEERGAIESAIDQSGVSAGHEFVSKAQALTRFRQEFAELASLTESFDDNPFPASIEVRVGQGAERDGRTDALVRQLVKLPGVIDVRYDREWLVRVASALDTVRAAGVGLALLMGLAAVVTVATVVRLGLLVRRDEIEIMELVGAPLTFIRGPFVAEGFLQGGIGALLAIAVLWLSHALANAWWGVQMRALLDNETLRFLPFRLSVLLIAGGMFVGSAGGFMAAWRAGSDPALTEPPQAD
jgi:cell division transport system permease protein